MSQYVTLIGAEDVRHAGAMMQSASQEMQRAASVMVETAHRLQIFLDDWLRRFEQVLENNNVHMQIQ